MVAGCLSGSGYHMGPHLHRATEGNQKGFFESPPINRINDTIIRPAVPTRPPIVGRWTHPSRLGRTHMWLAQVPVGTSFQSSERIRSRMRRHVTRQPYCFKDPRFSYTLPLWRCVLDDTVFVCVFRHPVATARSIVKETSRARYAGLNLDVSAALGIYTCMYEHILTEHRSEGDWLFLHFDQVLQGDGLERLSRFLEANVDRTFPESTLRHSTEGACDAPRAMQAYTTLCELAGFSPP